MKLKKIIYISRIVIPRRNAHTIQIIKTSASFAQQGIDVVLYAKINKFKENKDIFDYFGLQAKDNMFIKTVPPPFRFSRKLIALFISFRSLFERSDTVFYIRGYKLANEMIWLKWLHRMPVFVELHSFPEVVSTESPYYEFASRVHTSADGLIFTYKATKTLVASSCINTPIIHAWSATEPVENHEYSFMKRTGIYYVGNFYKYHRMDMLFDAMRQVEGEKLILVGGNNEEDISRTMDCAKNIGVAEKVVFNGYAKPKEIKNLLRTARLAVMTYFGIKLNDYLSAGLPIVAPDHPFVKEVLHDGKDCIMFQQGNSESLACAINKVLENPDFAETIARNAYKTAQEYSWQKRAEKIVNFIENNIR